MFIDLTGIGWGIVSFAVLIVIGIVVVLALGESVGGLGNTTAYYVVGQLGENGLAGWIPAVIAITIGMGVLFLFAGKKSKS